MVELTRLWKSVGGEVPSEQSRTRHGTIAVRVVMEKPGIWTKTGKDYGKARFMGHVDLGYCGLIFKFPCFIVFLY